MTARLLTTTEVAERFRTSASTVRYWRHLGIGPAGIRVGRRVLYDEAECDRWWQAKVTREAQGSPAEAGCPALAGRGGVGDGHPDLDSARARSRHRRRLGRPMARLPDRSQAEH